MSSCLCSIISRRFRTHPKKAARPHHDDESALSLSFSLLLLLLPLSTHNTQKSLLLLPLSTHNTHRKRKRKADTNMKFLKFKSFLYKWRKLGSEISTSSSAGHYDECWWASCACFRGGSEQQIIPRDVPKGHLVVYVGGDFKRFVIRVKFLEHPLFRELLDRAREEYDFCPYSRLCIPCDENIFLNVIHHEFRIDLFDYEQRATGLGQPGITTLETERALWNRTTPPFPTSYRTVKIKRCKGHLHG
ncbi:hypothetical protein ACLOJK_009605 [Asimina triloba]